MVDPLLPTNNLGRSVGKASLYRIRMALQLGAERLRGICEEAREAGGSITPEETERRMLGDFFRNTMQARSPPSTRALSAVPRLPHFVPPAADFILEDGSERGEGEWKGEGEEEEEGLREEEAWGGVRVPGGAEVLQPLAGLLNSLPAEGAPPPHAGGCAARSKALPGREAASVAAAKAAGPALAANAFPFRPPAARELLCRSPDPGETARVEGETGAELRERLETAHRNLALAQQCLTNRAPQTVAAAAVAADAAAAAGKGERSAASAAAAARGTTAREGPGPRRGAGGETRSGSQGGGGRRGRGGEGKEGGGKGRRKGGRDRGKDGGAGGRPHPKQPPPPAPAPAPAASPFALRPDEFPSLGA